MRKPFQLEQGKDEIISAGGNVIAGSYLNAIFNSSIPENFIDRRADAISDRDILATMTGLLSNAHTDFTNVKFYQNDEVFTSSFGIKNLPSEETLRLRLDEFKPTPTYQALNESNTQLIKQQQLTSVNVGEQKMIPVDFDVSPMDNSGSKKQGVSRTYKKHDGYAPMFAYIGAEGYMLRQELREGSQHCQVATPKFIAESLKQLEELGLKGKCLLRLDSGNDAEENFQHLGDEHFIIKRNLRREQREQWLATARQIGELKEDTREGKNVYIGFAHHHHPGGAKSTSTRVPVAFEVIERTCDHNGDPLLIPSIEVNTFWTNLACCTASEVISLYHAHGTSEQFHSELKSDMNIEQLPSGKFAVNTLIMHCAMIAFNLLRAIGQEVIHHAHLAPIKIKVQRWRLKTVLRHIIYSPVRLIRHARRTKLRFGKLCPWFDLIKAISTAWTRSQTEHTHIKNPLNTWVMEEAPCPRKHINRTKLENLPLQCRFAVKNSP